MSNGYVSSFDGLPEFSIPSYPVGFTQQVVTTDVTTSVVSVMSAVSSGGGSGVDNSIRDMIIAKAKLSNQITEDLVKKYHESFMSLYNYTQKEVLRLEQEVDALKNPAREIFQTIEFIPKEVTVKPEMTQYIIQANLLGVDLIDVLPPELLPS
jgi:hypothetical protein